MGTFALQVAFMSVYINKFYFDYLNDERLAKLMESILPKSSPVVLCIRNEDFEFLKTLDESIQSVEDLTKVDELIWVII